MLSAYQAVLRSPDARRLLLTALVGRLPDGMLGFVYLLIIRDVGGAYAAVGLILGGYWIALAVGSPCLGRLVDLLGARRIVTTTALAETLTIVAFVLASRADASTTLLIAVAACSGLVVPPISAAIRREWSRRFTGAELEKASALEAIVLQIVFLVAPGLAAALAGLSSPQAAAWITAILTVGGSIAFAMTPTLDSRSDGRRSPSWLGPLRSRAVCLLIAVVASGGIAGGFVAVGLPAFAEQHGAIDAVGILFVVLSAASLAAGVWYGGRAWRAGPGIRLLALTAIAAVGGASLALADSMVTMAMLLVLYGANNAPLFTVVFTLVGALAPPGTTGEAYAWLTAGVAAGTAVGSVVAGAVVEQAGTAQAFLLAGGTLAIGTVVILVGLSSLRIPYGVTCLRMFW